MLVNKSRSSVLALVEEAEVACSNGDFKRADALYSSAILLDSTNPILFGNRSAARASLRDAAGSMEDAEKAIQLDPKYIKGYYRLGVALEISGNFFQSIVAFAKAMSLDSKNGVYLKALIDTALISSLKDSLKPVMNQLQDMELENNPFVITSVIGQDLLAHDAVSEAAEVLECAISIGTCSLKLKGSVYSALSSALWSLDCHERSIMFMKEDLAVSQALSDISGECRAHGNLGAAYMHQGKLDEAVQSYKNQLVLAQKMKHKKLTAAAYSGLGLVCTALGDHEEALHHHQLAQDILAKTNDVFLRCRELSKIGQCHLMLNDPQDALQCLKERLRLASSSLQDGDSEEAQAYFDLAAAYKALQSSFEEIECLRNSADIYKKLNDGTNEAKALASLGFASRREGDLPSARAAYERLLEIALNTGDRSLESRACANLGIVHHQASDYEMALKLQAQCLTLAKETNDRGSQGRAYGNMGNAYSALGLYEQAVNYHLKELEMSSAIKDKESECSTHGNLAVAYQAMHVDDRALHHYRCQYELAKEIGSFSNQSRALMNLGNYYNTLGQFREAMEFYNEYLILLDQTPDKSGRCRALYNLGFACFSLRNYQDAMLSYQKSVEVAAECQDKVAMARAYCNLGLARKELGQYDMAFDCQNTFLSLSTELKSVRGKFKALGNLGDIFVAKTEYDQAVGFYQQQMAMAEQNADSALIAQACASLGTAFRKLGQLEQATELHGKEVELYQNSVKDAGMEYKAQGRLGAALTELERFHDAAACYERQLELGRTCSDSTLESQAMGNLAITFTNLHDFVNAKKYFEKQSEILSGLKTKSSKLERCKAFCSLGDCCEALEQYSDAVLFRQTALSLSNELQNLTFMEKSLKGLTSAHRMLEHIDQALLFCQQRLTVCERLGNVHLAAAALGDMAILQSSLGQYEQALQSLKQQMKIGVDLSDEAITGDAACGMGSVHHLMKDYDSAIKFHSLDLEISQRSNNRPCQGRAHGNLASAYEKIKNFENAVSHQEQHLFIAKEQGDEVAKHIALFGIGRNTLLLSRDDCPRAALLLQQAMLLQTDATCSELSIKNRYYLGIAMWACGNEASAIEHFKKAIEIAEGACTEKLSQRHLQNGDAYSMDLLCGLFSLLSMSYSSLMCVLSVTSQMEEALTVAEKGNSFLELFLCNAKFNRQDDFVSVKRMLDYCEEKNTVLLYFTVSASRLFCWLLTPDKKFFSLAQVLLSTADETSERSNAFHQLIVGLWQTLGIDNPDIDLGTPESPYSAAFPSERSSFTGLLQSQHAFQWTCDHISTAKGCLLPSDDIQHLQKGKTPHNALYGLLLSKVDQYLKKFVNPTSPCSLSIVASGDLLLVPFCMLRKKSSDPFLSQIFCVTVVSSFHMLNSEPATPAALSDCNRGMVIGNPLLPKSLQEEGWITSHASEEEANLISGILRVEPLTGRNASRAAVLPTLDSVELLHFACHVSYSSTSPGIVLGCDGRELLDDSPLHAEENALEFPVDSLSDTSSSPASLEEHLLTATDLLSCDLTATKLVVLGASHLSNTESGQSHVSCLASALSTLSKSFSVAGTSSLLVSMWPVPETAAKLVFQTFYAKLLDGSSTSEALSFAMATLRNSQQFEHPSYWAGFVLVGPSVRLTSKDLTTIYALASVLQGNALDAMSTLKMVNHLIHKSIQRTTAHDLANSIPMYTSQASVSSKLNNARGWRKLFSAAGFELRPSSNGLPSAVFFPQTGFESILPMLAEALAPFLDLSPATLDGIGRLTLSPCAAASIQRWLQETVMRELTNGFSSSAPIGESPLLIDRSMWETDGCSQLLCSLGINFVVVCEDAVKLSAQRDCSTDVVKAAAEALNTLFGDESSTMERSSCLTYPSAIGYRKNSSAAISIIQPFPSAKRFSLVDFSANVDFNISFHSMTSEGSSQQFGSSEHSAVQRSNCGILTLEEPKVFTQELPKNSGLVAPKPVMPAKSPLASPAKIPPTIAFSPSKKLQYAASVGAMTQSRSPSLIKAAQDTVETRRGSDPRLTLAKVPADISGQSSLGMFYQGNRSTEAKVCVVNPTPGDKRSPQTTESRFMSVFESMLSKKPEKLHPRQNSLASSEFSSASHQDVEKPCRSADVPATGGAYKPAPSAASVLYARSPQHEYNDIVDKLSDVQVSIDPVQDATLTRTHTAYRLVQSDRRGDGAAPKLQAYEVRTVFVPISTSESTVIANRSASSPAPTVKPNRRLGQNSPTKPVLPGTSLSSQSNIFQHLAPVDQLGTTDDRVQFV